MITPLKSLTWRWQQRNNIGREALRAIRDKRHAQALLADAERRISQLTGLTPHGLNPRR